MVHNVLQRFLMLLFGFLQCFLFAFTTNNKFIVLFFLYSFLLFFFAFFYFFFFDGVFKIFLIVHVIKVNGIVLTSLVIMSKFSSFAETLFSLDENIISCSKFSSLLYCVICLLIYCTCLFCVFFYFHPAFVLRFTQFLNLLIY